MRALLLVLAAASLATAAPALGQRVGVPLGGTPNLNLTGFNGQVGALPDAVAAIEKLSGGRVAEIRFDNIGGAPGYDVVLVQGDHVRFQRFSRPGDRLVAFTQTSTPKWMLGWQNQRNATLVKNARVPLSDAIRTAEASVRGGAPAVAAGISHGASSPTTRIHAYNVALLRNGSQQRVAVNSDSGAIITNPGALPRW
jgi:uncharacterized membrane protein YkoI